MSDFSMCWIFLEELGEFAEVFGQKCIKTSNVVSSYSPVIFTALPEKIPDTPVAYASHSHLYQDSMEGMQDEF